MIHVIGANGYIGTRLCQEMDNRGFRFDRFSDVADSNCKRFDLRFDDARVLSLKSGDIVILLAAISSPDICQKMFEFAYSINVIGTSKLIDYCLAHNVRVIFMSSDTVNGPTANPNTEFSAVRPFGNYAKMKYEIESRYKNSPLFKTLRLSYVLSDSDKFICYLSSCVAKGVSAEVFRGLYRNVVKLETVIEAICNLCERFDLIDFYLINVCGNQSLSRLDLAQWYKLNIDRRLLYTEIDVPQSVLEGRPNVILTKSLFLAKLLGHEVENIL